MSSQINTLLEKALEARREDRPEVARRALLEAKKICRSSGTKAELARTLKALGQIERDLGQSEAALLLYQEAVAIYRSEPDALALAHTIRHVADIQQDLGRNLLAEPDYREALRIYRAHTETPALDLANAIRGLAVLMFDTRKDEEAKALWQEARDIYSSVNVQAGVNESSRRLTLLASR